MSRSVITGVSLGAATGIAYTLCAVAFRLWPEAGVAFMNSLFHGLDFRRLQAGAEVFDFRTFLFALVVLVLAAFILGCVFGWIADRLRARGS